MLYLVAAGLERFFIEFLRISPRIAFGLTGAQIISIVLVSAGLLGLYVLGKNSMQDNLTTGRPAL
jgi:phosphatidylglycerol:prolipoprotein diacylglycerol transferase